MSKMIAYCGLVCSDCPTYIATQNDDDLARERTASYYSKQFGFDIKPAEINCDGCKSDGVLIGYCLACKIRDCCREKALDNCALCDEHPCEKLNALHELSPDARASFLKLRRSLGLGRQNPI